MISPNNNGMFYMEIKPKRINIPKLSRLPKKQKQNNKNNDTLPADVGYIFQSEEEVSR
jgi:hypothetical protein